jgi:hypothetical protein
MRLLHLLDPIFYSFVLSDWLLKMTGPGRVPWWLPCCPSDWAVRLLRWLDIGHNWRQRR